MILENKSSKAKFRLGKTKAYHRSNHHKNNMGLVRDVKTLGVLVSPIGKTFH